MAAPPFPDVYALKAVNRRWSNLPCEISNQIGMMTFATPTALLIKDLKFTYTKPARTRRSRMHWPHGTRLQVRFKRKTQAYMKIIRKPADKRCRRHKQRTFNLYQFGSAGISCLYQLVNDVVSGVEPLGWLDTSISDDGF